MKEIHASRVSARVIFAKEIHADWVEAEEIHAKEVKLGRKSHHDNPRHEQALGYDAHFLEG
ncbi:hypothetical protein [Myxococcus sp. AB056]|uniref:hypothetical protein n=1 Tax=Myxococcus sp. AB056 TaxID=2562792 RepID=UPI0011472DE5|nr:hypothetical protein [Myxococcus sp. AB056]